MYLISTILLSMVVLAVATGQTVNNPADCDSGYARISESTNGTTNLVCIDAEVFGSWSTPLDFLTATKTATSAKPVSQDSIDVQMDLAESSTVWTNADELYWHYKFKGFEEENLLGIEDYNRIVWNYIWAFFILLLEVVKLIFYLVEILLVIYVLFTLIPETFFRLRDTLVKSYIRRYAT
ncbi:hypothetical protein LCGC14_2054390 [marine sediment metagenome]|uniref:Uncharacterized protein n=1 Tax=marine sediment metagenome TaxID=412755 RepID=A0A0F9EMZ7_9ZZZZ